MGGDRIVYVDGYNVIRRVPEWNTAFHRNRARARDALTAYCAGWRNSRRDILDVVVVFDGDSSVRGAPSPMGGAGVRSVFTRTGEPADRFIMDSVRQAAGSRRITVVSDDAEIVRTVRACRAEVMSVAEFRAARSRKERPGDGPGSDKAGPQAQRDINAWLRGQFGLGGEEG